jgi:hypothetical protein
MKYEDLKNSPTTIKEDSGTTTASNIAVVAQPFGAKLEKQKKSKSKVAVIRRT